MFLTNPVWLYFSLLCNRAVGIPIRWCNWLRVKLPFVEFILNHAECRILCERILFDLNSRSLWDYRRRSSWICSSKWSSYLHFFTKVLIIMLFNGTHECTELPSSSQGRQKGSGRWETQIALDPDAIQRQEPQWVTLYAFLKAPITSPLKSSTLVLL
jgi:hypothetical protein